MEKVTGRATGVRGVGAGAAGEQRGVHSMRAGRTAAGNTRVTPFCDTCVSLRSVWDAAQRGGSAAGDPSAEKSVAACCRFPLDASCGHKKADERQVQLHRATLHRQLHTRRHPHQLGHRRARRLVRRPILPPQPRHLRGVPCSASNRSSSRSNGSSISLSSLVGNASSRGSGGLTFKSPRRSVSFSVRTAIAPQAKAADVSQALEQHVPQKSLDELHARQLSGLPRSAVTMVLVTKQHSIVFDRQQTTVRPCAGGCAAATNCGARTRVALMCVFRWLRRRNFVSSTTNLAKFRRSIRRVL